MKIRKDILGKEPKIGDTICWNPARYKGIVYGTIVDFRPNNGLPIVLVNEFYHDKNIGPSLASDNKYVPKTGFVIVN